MIKIEINCEYLEIRNLKKLWCVLRDCFVDNQQLCCKRCLNKNIIEKIKKSNKKEIKNNYNEKEIIYENEVQHENANKYNINNANYKIETKEDFCIHIGKTRIDLPHRGPCCVPHECKNEKVKLDVVNWSLCHRCKYREPGKN